MHRTWPRLVGVLAFVLAWATPAWGAEAPDPQGATTWTVLPATADQPDDRPWYEYVVDPGQDYSDAVAVRNLGTNPIDLAVYAVDGMSTDDGSFAVAASDDPKTDLGGWIQLETTSVHVDPGQTAVVPFTVTVPTDAQPGDHFGGIVASVTTGAPDDGTPVIRENRVGVRLYVRVTGPVSPSLTLTSLTATHDQPVNPLRGDTLMVSQTLVNDGNLRLDSSRTLEVSGLFGWWHRTVRLDDTSEMMPGNATSLTSQVASVPPLGPMTVTASVIPQTSAGDPVTGLPGTEKTITVWLIPWPQLAALAILGLLVWQAVAAARRVRSLKAQLAAARSTTTDSSTQEPAPEPAASSDSTEPS